MRLSMVTISYNAESCIKKTMESVLNQTKPVYEYILIDGGSTDSTFDIICTYRERFEQKGTIFQCVTEKDKGISDAFNKGIQRATGDIVGLVNADDELLPETCMELSKAYESVEADIYYGNCIWEDAEAGLRYVARPKHNLDRLLYYMVLMHPATYVRKTAYDEVGLFDVTYRYCMDKELMYRMYNAGKRFRYIDSEFVIYRAGGVSDKRAIEVYKEGSRMALSYGEPRLKVLMIEKWKILKKVGVSLCKNTKLYQRWKTRR